MWYIMEVRGSSGRWNSMVSGLDKYNHHLPTVDSLGERKEGKNGIIPIIPPPL